MTKEQIAVAKRGVKQIPFCQYEELTERKAGYTMVSKNYQKIWQALELLKGVAAGTHMIVPVEKTN